jgi:citrate synthase
MKELQAERPRVYEGLDGVVVSETLLSHVDGESGFLVVAGHDIEELASEYSFEQAACLLFRAAGDQAATVESVQRGLQSGREQAFLRLSTLGDALDQVDAMDALRAATGHLSERATREQIVGAMAVFTAAHCRRRAGLPAIAPPARAGHAEALLTMLGVRVDPARVRALDAYLVTVMEHGFNASAFAARVVASTRSDLVSAVVAGIGALKGPLHGGAPGPVLELLETIATSDRIEACLQRELAEGRRIMGMGHRIYRQRDPRAYVLERALEQLSAASSVRSPEPEACASLHTQLADDTRLRSRLTLARQVERAAEALLEARHPGRNLRANVEFYTAVLLSALDIPGASFAAVFACARSTGWAAHVAEQRTRGKLIRPRANYIGPLPVRAVSA